VPPAGFEDGVRATLGTGIFGYVRETHQVTSGGTTHVTSTLMIGAKVQLVADTGQPPSLATCAFSPSPMVSTVTDSTGVYELPAPPGQWYLESCTESGTISVPFNDVDEIDLDLNDVPK
jgi:hypothetical protein